MTTKKARDERLQIMVSLDELKLVDDFRYKARMPSRAAAVRELLKRGLAAEGGRSLKRRVCRKRQHILRPP